MIEKEFQLKGEFCLIRWYRKKRRWIMGSDYYKLLEAKKEQNLK